MILSKENIQARIKSGNIILEPYSEESQQPASYDLRAGDDYLLKKGERCVQAIMHEVTDGKTLYNGRYQDSVGAVGARN